MIISQIMIWIVELLTKIPYACIPAKLNIYLALLLSITICILIQIFWNKFKKLKRKKWSFNIKNYLIPTTVIASLICLFIFIPKSSDTELIMLDVGQGDSIYLKSKESNFLIDTGNQDNKLKSNFAELGITHLDGILITHPDDDHCGSLDVIKDLIDVSKVYIAADLLNSNNSNCKKLVGQIKDIVNKNDIVSLNVGDKISFGEYELDVIWPDKYSDEGGNCDSLTVIANVDINNDGDIESRVLLCGDAEKSEINQMFKKSRIPKIDIYKCGHHGSKNAIDEQAANLLKPKITLISVGAKNRYGHPSQNTISMLENANSKIYRTDKSGTIFCSFDYGQINIKTEK